MPRPADVVEAFLHHLAVERGSAANTLRSYTVDLERYVAHLDAAGVHTQMAVIALPNDASEALHQSLGFERVGVLREVGCKFGRYIDTAWWQRLS